MTRVGAISEKSRMSHLPQSMCGAHHNISITDSCPCTFRNNWRILMKLGMKVMPLEATQLLYIWVSCHR